MNDEALFVTAENEYPTMARLASHFFRELQAFGALQTLETTCGLRFWPAAQIPFCCNTGEWNKAAPIAGYSSEAPDVRPSEVAVS